ncbi:Lipoprotein signal peptidase (EC 3.4.23.36) [uncultured Gammaproteobacteria bacterium]|jgi:signal peptidase II|nr:Lipoprotein signal peptidase (EC [Bathymodiolus brooksi thiotrophic gill symbiont]CAC9546113.1 Lipoprotein signal peptidase (EC 3.4.23.36) [uncultured Gammaproteobacteria bacterium]CAC9552819.1 Lipoprotein signal peptidase (EC 3.4.23.36) [uncultured Gammaproteobacteria bacterium]CAC9612962.1 Lipoprotein signal peptidase (EC 3.4.23.36) [uncultured Gammaproteobacteria bacterium]CAC9620973.1 Lipoprotein signal peptidase (EC 3.4.23.36) [uncultured Gammaproteobacteria bacterium]
MKIIYFLLAILLVALDQLTKLLAYEYLVIGTSVDINAFFSLSFARNYGAAFSFLADQGGWQRYFLSAVSVIASIILSVWMVKTSTIYRFKLIGLTLILSGAVGNMIDRVMNGFVVDFIDFHYQDFYWPIFNFADIFISIGVVMLIIADWKK